ncbi:MAG: flagellar basal body-associated FliL family protein [Treponema sp.]|nr:flagellar basal body-associated FliL family protein [Treponema sp.]
MYDERDFGPGGQGGNPYERFEKASYPQKDSGLPKILLFVLIGVVLVFVLGTIIALATKKGNIGHAYRHSDPSPEKVVNRSQHSSKRLTTAKLGQLRVTTLGETDGNGGSVLVVSPWFSYPEGDVQLFEEISQKDRLIKSIVHSYFSGKSKSQLLSLGEKKVKDELKTKINEQLVLGDVEAVYFDEYIFFEGTL